MRNRAAPFVVDIPLSNVSGADLETLRELLQPAQTFYWLGSSGVGKTTLLNTLLGESAFAAGEVREGSPGKA